MRYILSIIFSILTITGAVAAGEGDTLCVENSATHKGMWSVRGSANVSRVFNNDDAMNEFLHSHAVNYYDLRVNWRAAADTQDPYDQDMGRPYLFGGVMYGDYNRLNIKRPEREYRSHVGEIITVYGGAQFDIFHYGRWTVDADLRNGIGICTHPYNERTNRDQEIVGSCYSIYVAGGLHVGYRLSPHWKVSGGVDMQHYSNGTLDRPNIGANTGGFTVAMTYDFEPQQLKQYTFGHGGELKKPFMDEWEKQIYIEATAGIAMKALADRFDLTASSHNPLYVSFTTMMAPMWRYHRLHATGIGVDYTYGNYVYKIRDIDRINNNAEPSYSPHIIGLSLRHEVFYKHVSVNVGIGVYLNKKTGHSAVVRESKSYQNVGLRYSFPFTNDRLFVGYNVKAHNFSKVDCVQLLTGYRFVI